MPAKHKSDNHSRATTTARKTAKTPRKARGGATKTTPTGFVTNESLEIVEFLGDASSYLDVMPGKADLKLRTMVPPLLYREVQAAVKETAAERLPNRPRKCVLLGGRHKQVNIKVRRFKKPSVGNCYRILLEDAGPSPRSTDKKEKPKAPPAEESKVVRLKQELAATKETFLAILAEQKHRYEAALKQPAAVLQKPETFAAALEVAHTELEAAHERIDAQYEELRAALEESELRETRYQEREGSVQALLENAAQGIVLVGRHGRIQSVNSTAAKLHGYRREELLGQPVEMLVPGDLRRVHRQHRRDYLHQPRTRPMGQDLDLFACRKDGTTFPVEISLSHIEEGDSLVTAAFISDITERKKAEASLRESEERFRHLANNAPVLVWTSGTDKGCTWFNQPWLEFTGRTMEQELGDGWTEGVHPEDIDRCLGTYSEAFDARTPFTMEYRLRHADGQYHWVLDTGIPQYKAAEFTGYLGTCIDITARKRSEEQLRLQAAIAANMVEGMALVRARDGVIVHANETYHKVFGYEPGELHGKHVSVLNAGSRADAEAAARALSKLLNREKVWKGEVRNVRKDGTAFWSSANISTLEHEKYGTVWLRVSRDITPRVEAEQKLREELAFNAALVDTLRALVVVLDREGRIVRFNRSCQTVTGYTFEEVEGRHVWDFLLPPEEAKGVRQTFSHLRGGKGANTFENHWLTKQGDRRLISWSNVALGDDDGTVRFVIGTGIDITERRKMEETIRRNRNELSQLTIRLTDRQEEEYRHLSRELHDVFSQRLTMLGIHISDLEQNLSAVGVSDGNSLGRIGAEISQLASQIHGISRRLHPAILDDLGLAAALKNECLAFAREHGIEVACQSEGRCDRIPSDIALCLYRVAQASLNNIRRHSRAKHVEIRLACTREEVSLSIEDFGRGFKPVEVRGKGGLGLVSIEERVRAVDGKLTIDSAPGKGARIVVHVPLRKSRKRRAKA